MLKANMINPKQTLNILLGLFIVAFVFYACDNNVSSEDEFSKVEKEVLSMLKEQASKNIGIKLTSGTLTEFDIESAEHTGELSNGIQYAVFSGITAAIYGYAKVAGDNPECSISEDDIGFNRTTKKFISCVLDILEDCGEGAIHVEEGEVHVHSTCVE